MTEKRFVPVEEIRRLSEGSYEHVIAIVESALHESAQEIFGRPCTLRVCGTFPGSLIALTEDGEVRRVFWEQASDGSIAFVRSVVEEVRAYNPDNLEQFVLAEVRRGVKAWKAGRVEEAKEIISSVAPYVGDRVDIDDTRVVEMLRLEVTGHRPWRALYATQKQRIFKTVGLSKVRQIREDALEPKFAQLTSGSLDESDVSGYHRLVRADLDQLETRVRSLADLVSAGYSSVGSLLASSQLSEDAAIKTFQAFSEDLIHDLNRLSSLLPEAARQLSKTASLGKLHDVIAADLFDREVAGCFVTTMADQLQETIQ